MFDRVNALEFLRAWRQTISGRVDYVIAGRVGGWPFLRPAMALWRSSAEDRSELCLRFGRGQVQRGDKVGWAYEYYRSVWTSIATEALAAFLICAVVVKAVEGPTVANRVLLLSITVPWLFLAIVSMVLVGLGVLKGGLSDYQARLDDKSKSANARLFQNGGNIDFWIALAIGILASVLCVVAAG